MRALDGMNSALDSGPDRIFQQAKSANSSDSNLSTALTVHGYLKYGNEYTGIGDISKTINLVKLIMHGEKAAEGALSTFSKTSSRMATASEVISAIGKGISVVSGGINIGLDAYELAHAENSTRKVVFGTQLAFDFTSLAVGVASIGAGLVGVASAAAVLGCF